MMKKILITTLLLIMVSNISCANDKLSKKQKKVKQTAKKIGSTICVDSMCFGKTLQSISFVESSYGKNLLDKKCKKTKNYKLCSLGTFQVNLDTAIEVIKKQNLEKYKFLLKNQNILIEKLLYDVEFGAIIAANYLKMNYEIGLQRKVKNPWKFAVSRYNGGNINNSYLEKIISKIQ